MGSESGPNGAGTISDDAGLEEMVNLANSQQQQLREASAVRNPSETGSVKSEELQQSQPQPPPPVSAPADGPIQQDNNLLLPVNVKRFALFLGDSDDDVTDYEQL